MEEASMSEPCLLDSESDTSHLEDTQRNSNFPTKAGLFLHFSYQPYANDNSNVKQLISLLQEVRHVFFRLLSSSLPSYNTGRKRIAIITLPKSNQRHQCYSIN